MLRRPQRLLIAGVVTAAVLAVGGPHVYINYIQDDAPAALSRLPASRTLRPRFRRGGRSRGRRLGAGESSGSQAGCRVDEVLFGQDTTAVGRTEEATGELEIEGTRATSGAFTADLASPR
ncbi:hypothetical protein [Streptomyces neyagawaensis]|uniref:hypothetical protein n=1 Tax=Streptomyces neyagawaensis TaxID=42238 RepID=UPI0006E4103C|nr:hypothetical protein [Streptomyces neyagawaensis]MCL6735852.1 hypothetical protein [Streptomyces neyagawaensis]MDE1686342.1 hypothetical protein [Streptomyces neyagawaensis]